MHFTTKLFMFLCCCYKRCYAGRHVPLWHIPMLLVLPLRSPSIFDPSVLLANFLEVLWTFWLFLFCNDCQYYFRFSSGNVRPSMSYTNIYKIGLLQIHDRMLQRSSSSNYLWKNAEGHCKKASSLVSFSALLRFLSRICCTFRAKMTRQEHSLPAS